jgi:hypothetical protein
MGEETRKSMDAAEISALMASLLRHCALLNYLITDSS